MLGFLINSHPKNVGKPKFFKHLQNIYNQKDIAFHRVDIFSKIKKGCVQILRKAIKMNNKIVLTLDID